MRSFRSPALALAALTLATIATPSFAGSPYYDDMGAPMTSDQADMVMQNRMMDASMMGAQAPMRGRYTCSSMEKRTRLERKACGTTKMIN